MHHDRHPPHERCDTCADFPLYWFDLAARLEQLKEIIVTNQEHIDADVAALGDALANIESEIAALKAQPAAEALDFSGLDAAVARSQADGEQPAEAPADPADGPPADPTP